MSTGIYESAEVPLVLARVVRWGGYLQEGFLEEVLAKWNPDEQGSRASEQAAKRHGQKPSQR